MAYPQVTDKQPPDRGVAANILNKQLQTADEGLSFSLGVGQGAKMLQKFHKASDLETDPLGHVGYL
jgi:hypothetical protein